MNALSTFLNKFIRYKTDTEFDPPSRDFHFLQRRMRALKALETHGMHAHYYIPTTKIEDHDLANACRFLAGSGYIITDERGNFVGKIARVEHGDGALSPVNSLPFKIRPNRAK